MTGFDIAVLLLVGLGAVTGFMRGFVQEILALGAWIFALFVIYAMHTPLTAFLRQYVDSPSGAAILAFAVLLLVPYAAVKALANFAGRSSRASVIGPIDRVLGFGFGGIKGLIIAVLGFSILVLGFDITWGVGGRPTWITQARTYPFIDSGSEQLVKILAERRRAAADSGSSRNREK